MALDFLKDYPASVQAVPNLRPEQLAVQNQALGNAGNLLNQTGDYRFDFAPIEEKARRDFQTRTVPTLAERFAGGGARGSAFQGALGAAGSDLESNLAALRSEYGLRNQAQQQGHLSNLLGYGLQPSFENIYTPSQPGFAKSIAPGLINAGTQLGVAALQGAGQGIGQTIAQGAGAAAVPAAIAGATKAATGAGVASSAFLPVLGGFGAAAALAGLGYGIYRLATRGKRKEAKALMAQLQQMEEYQRQHPEEFPSDFPVRNRGESLEKWNRRVLRYTKNRQARQFSGQQPQQLIEVD